MSFKYHDNEADKRLKEYQHAEVGKLLEDPNIGVTYIGTSSDPQWYMMVKIGYSEKIYLADGTTRPFNQWNDHFKTIEEAAHKTATLRLSQYSEEWALPFKFDIVQKAHPSRFSYALEQKLHVLFSRWRWAMKPVDQVEAHEREGLYGDKEIGGAWKEKTSAELRRSELVFEVKSNGPQELFNADPEIVCQALDHLSPEKYIEFEKAMLVKQYEKDVEEETVKRVRKFINTEGQDHIKEEIEFLSLRFCLLDGIFSGMEKEIKNFRENIRRILLYPLPLARNMDPRRSYPFTILNDQIGIEMDCRNADYGPFAAGENRLHYLYNVIEDDGLKERLRIVYKQGVRFGHIVANAKGYTEQHKAAQRVLAGGEPLYAKDFDFELIHGIGWLWALLENGESIYQ